MEPFNRHQRQENEISEAYKYSQDQILFHTHRISRMELSPLDSRKCRNLKRSTKYQLNSYNNHQSISWENPVQNILPEPNC